MFEADPPAAARPAEEQRESMAESSRAWVRERLARLEILIAPSASVARNLEIDEEMTRSGGGAGRAGLRLWWGSAPAVVVGNSERPEIVADLAACERLGIPVLRRKTGGGTVLQTPDVLNYSLTAPGARLLDVRIVFELGALLLVRALANLGLHGEMRGTSDVVVGNRKISGNAQARRWGGVLLHGTLLLDLDLDLVETCLRQPEYRRGRSHRDFLTTLRSEGVAAGPLAVQSAVVAAAWQLSREGL